MRRRSAILVGAFVVVGCAAKTAPSPKAVPSPPSDDSWARATWEERHDTMTFLVLPEMARAFQRFDRTTYPELTCRSCHGQDGERIGYRMPNGPPLDPAHLPRKDSSDPREAKTAAFMIDEVTPALADMIGKPDVGCFTCHVRGPK